MLFNLNDLMEEFERSFLFAVILVLGNLTKSHVQSLQMSSIKLLVEAVRDLARRKLI